MTRVTARISRKRWRPSFGLRIRVDAEAYSIERFVAHAASTLLPGQRVLDAGAGDCPYRALFAHTAYEACDMVQNAAQSLTFLCDVQTIPCPNNHYDAVLSTQVLDDVPDPQRVIDEVFRILRPGGSLFLTAPQGWGIHNAPYHYFNFTSYGLRLLLERAGFEVRSIAPRGGIFWYLGKRIRTLLPYIYSQYRGVDGYRIHAALLAPLYWIFLPVCRIAVPLMCFYLDSLDRRQDYTLGYACQAVKPACPLAR